MKLEWWYYLAGIVSAGVGAAGLIALIVYALDTRKLRKAAEDQLESTARPCVLLLANPKNTTAFDNQPLILKNVGKGVALNIRYQLAKSQDGPWIEAPALEVGGVVESHMRLVDLFGPNQLICEFESLSGTRYRTESFIGELTTDLDLRHKFGRIP